MVDSCGIVHCYHCKRLFMERVHKEITCVNFHFYFILYIIVCNKLVKSLPVDIRNFEIDT